MYTCYDVANYFLKCQNEDFGDIMSNLKLQKLVYYAQGFYLAIVGEPLFNEPIEACVHGPVCVDLYHKYKEYGNGVIPIPYDVNTLEIFDEKALEILGMVQNDYGQFSGWMLRNLSHEDTPWIRAFDKGRAVISHSAMKSYFKTLLIEDEIKPTNYSVDDVDNNELIEDIFNGNRACNKENSFMKTQRTDGGPITWTRDELYERKSIR